MRIVNTSNYRIKFQGNKYNLVKSINHLGIYKCTQEIEYPYLIVESRRSTNALSIHRNILSVKDDIIKIISWIEPRQILDLEHKLKSKREGKILRINDKLITQSQL